MTKVTVFAKSGNVHTSGGNVCDSGGNVCNSGGIVCNGGDIEYGLGNLGGQIVIHNLHTLALRIRGIACGNSITM